MANIKIIIIINTVWALSFSSSARIIIKTSSLKWLTKKYIGISAIGIPGNISSFIPKIERMLFNFSSISIIISFFDGEAATF